MARTYRDGGTTSVDQPSGAGVAPGKRTLTGYLAPRRSGSSGEPLRPDVQARFESSLGADLSAVRVHTGEDSADAASEAGAQAFAIGNDVHFGAGRYQPDDPFGLHLLAHEVAHTQQQTGGAVRPQFKLEGGGAAGGADEQAADHAADAMVAGKPANDADRVAKLQQDLVVEAQDNRSIVFTTSDAIDAIDERLKTATGDEKTELEAKKKDCAKRLSIAQGKLDLAIADLQLWEKRPDVSPVARQDMLARRGVQVSMGGWSTESASTVFDDKGVTRNSSTSATFGDGAGGSRTMGDSTSTNVGLTGASRTTATSDSYVMGDTTSKKSTSDTTSVDWSKGSISSSSTTGLSSTTAGGEKSAGASTTKSNTVGLDGITSSASTTTEADGRKETDASSTSITRKDGDVGVTRTTSSSIENKDKSASSTSSSVSGGVVDGKDGIGAFAGAEGSASKKTASGYEVKGGIKANGRVVLNVVKVDGSDPAKYRITLTITLGASVSAGGGVSKESGASGSVDLTGSGQIVAGFGSTLDEEATKAYLASLDAAEHGQSGGSPETRLIACGTSGDGWEAAADMYRAMTGKGGTMNNLADGQIVTGDVTVSGGGKASAGFKSSSGPSVGVSGGYEVREQVKFSMWRDGDKTFASYLIIDGSTTSGGGSVGMGAASFSGSGKSDHSSGKGYSFTVADSTPDAAGLREQLQGIHTVQALEDFAKAHPELVGTRTTTKSDGKELTTGIGVGPLGAELTTGGKTSEAHTEELDENGKVKSKTDSYTGDSYTGGKVKAGSLTWGSNKDEQLAATVVTTYDANGKPKQVASADLSTTDTSSSPDALGTIENIGTQITEDPLGLATGRKPLMKTEDKTAVAGTFLSDGDLQQIMSSARDQHRWTNCGVTDRDGWEACRKAIVAAGDDKTKVAAALAAYAGDGATTNHAQAIDELLGVQHGGGGDRYELPDGLGDVKKAYAKLVVGNPMAEIDALVDAGKLDEAQAKATELAGQCQSVADRIKLGKAEFQNVDVHSEMYGRASTRASELRTKQMELQVKASGGTISPDQLDRAKAAEEWNTLLGQCTSDAAEEEKVFEIIGANYDALLGNHEEAENIKYVNQLRELTKRWEPHYARMCVLADTYGFGQGVAWRHLKPDRVRQQLAYKGQNPMSDEVKAKQAEADQSSMMQSDQGEQAGRNLMMTAGMTHVAGGAWYGERSDEDMAAQDAALHDSIQAEWATYEAKIAQYRAKATQAMGKCNSMSGNQSAINQPAKIAWSQGFAKNAEAGQLWQQAQTAAKSKGKAVRQFRALWSNAWIAWDDAAEAFAKGDELQG